MAEKRCGNCDTPLQLPLTLDPALRACPQCGLVYLAISPGLSANDQPVQEKPATLHGRLAKLEAELTNLVQRLEAGIPVRVSPEFASVAEREAARLPELRSLLLAEGFTSKPARRKRQGVLRHHQSDG